MGIHKKNYFQALFKLHLRKKSCCCIQLIAVVGTETSSIYILYNNSIDAVPR